MCKSIKQEGERERERERQSERERERERERHGELYQLCSYQSEKEF